MSKWTSASPKFSFYRSEKVSVKFSAHKWVEIRTVGSWSSRRTWGDKQPPNTINVKSWIPKHQERAKDRWKDVNTWENIWHVHSLPVWLKLRFCHRKNSECFRGLLWVLKDWGWIWRVAVWLMGCHSPQAWGGKTPEERRRWVKVL